MCLYILNPPGQQDANAPSGTWGSCILITSFSPLRCCARIWVPSAIWYEGSQGQGPKGPSTRHPPRLAFIYHLLCATVSRQRFTFKISYFPQQRTSLIEFPCPPLRFVYLLFICLWTGFYELWPDVCLMSLYGLHLNWPMRTDLKIILLIVIWLRHWWLTFSSAYFSTLLVCLFVMLNLVKKQFYLPQKNIEIIGQCWQSDQMWTIWTWWE